jgi:hypothetical protein
MPVSETDFDGLVAAYETLRGRGEQAHARAGTFAYAALLTPGWASSRIDRDGGSWAMCVGHVRPARRLTNVDLNEVDGQFALTAYAATRDEITIATDPWALRGVYVAKRGNFTYASTSALVLARHLQATPSALGVACFLRTGWQIGRQTGWEGISRLEPGTCLRFRRTGSSEQIYWRPTVDPSWQSQNLDTIVDRFLEIGRETRRELSDGRTTWADLTGGYDSRLNTLLLRDVGAQFDTCTRGAGETPDVTVAREVARVASWQWQQLSLPVDWADRVSEQLPAAVAWSDGQLDAVNVSRGLWTDGERADVHRGVISGGGGEYVRNANALQEFPLAGRTKRVNYDAWVDLALLRPMDTGVFAEDPTPIVREDLRRRMLAWAEPYNQYPNTTQIDAMYLLKCTGHFGAYTSTTAGVIDTHLPFFAKPMIEAAMSVDFRYRRMDRLVRHMIERLDRHVASIPMASGGPAQPLRVQNLHRFAPLYVDLARRATRKISVRLTGREFRSRPQEHLTADGFRAERLALLSALGRDGRQLRVEDLCTAPLYRESELSALLHRASGPGFHDDTLLGRILTLELAFRAVDARIG